MDNQPLIPEEISKLCSLCAEEMAKSDPATSGPQVLTPKQREENLLVRMEEIALFRIQRLTRGLTTLLETLDRLSEEDPSQFPPSLMKAWESIAALKPLDVNELLENPISLKEYYGLSVEVLEKCYATASHEFESGHYQQAADILFYLSALDPDNSLFWLALGNAEFYCSNYWDALQDYRLAFYTNPHDPRSLLYGAHCYEALHKKDAALETVELAVKVASEDASLEEYQREAKNYYTQLKAA